MKYPTDAGLADGGVRALAREGRKLAIKVGEKRTAVRHRSRAMGRKLRALTRSIRRRSGEAKAEVLALTAQTGKLLEQTIREARKLAATARRRARGRGARAKLRSAHKLEELADRCEKVTEQINKRVNGEKITDRLISLWDPDARPSYAGGAGERRRGGGAGRSWAGRGAPAILGGGELGGRWPHGQRISSLTEAGRESHRGPHPAHRERWLSTSDSANVGCLPPAPGGQQPKLARGRGATPPIRDAANPGRRPIRDAPDPQPHRLPVA